MEILNARLHSKAIYIQMDANSKLGKDILKTDVHEQTANGAALAAIVTRNALTVVNSLRDRVKGVITRRRIIEGGQEESVIDFLIVSEDLVEDVLA